MNSIYLDNAATTKMDTEVISVITEVMQNFYGNPSSTHQFGREAKSLVETSRKKIASLLNIEANEIIFTSGGSEADNLVIINAVQNLGVTRIITTKIEHHAVLHTINYVKEKFKTNIVYLNVDKNGNINNTELQDLLNNRTEKTLVSLMLVNNEIGNILDVKKVSTLCTANDTYFHSDTVQAIGQIPLDFKSNSVNFFAVAAHKFHGPKGVGFAYVKKGTGILPLIHGGAQEKGARAGTENVANIVGMAKALEIAITNLEQNRLHCLELKEYFIHQLQQNFKSIQFNGDSAKLENSSPKVLSVRFKDHLPMLLFQLDMKNISVSGGSACQSGSVGGSHVLNEILSVEEAMKASVRFSFSKYTTKNEIDTTIQTLLELIPQK